MEPLSGYWGGISFTVGNEFVSLFGPNGSGKTTLLNIIAGIETQDMGTILINQKKPKKARLGFVFQSCDESLFPWKTVFENISFPLEIQKRPEEERVQIIEELLRSVYMLPLRNNFIYELSGGQKQLTAILRAFAMDPELLILDEPFSSLDHSLTRRMEIQLLGIWQTKKIPTIFVSHDIDEAIFLSDQVIILSSQPSRIKQLVNIDLPRPRTPEMLVSQEFLELKREILNSFGYEE